MLNLFVVTGISGSGKTSALNMLEDLGYYCIDNLPVALIKMRYRCYRPTDTIVLHYQLMRETKKALKV